MKDTGRCINSHRKALHQEASLSPPVEHCRHLRLRGKTLEIVGFCDGNELYTQLATVLEKSCQRRLTITNVLEGNKSKVSLEVVVAISASVVFDPAGYITVFCLLLLAFHT